MISERQLTANRQNAQHSTGPSTPEGKKRTRLNATRHGLTGQINIQTPEDRELHQKFCADLINGFQPETAHESQLAQSIADDYWRLNRIRAIENNIFALCSASAAETIRTHDPEVHAALTTAQVFLNESKQFHLLTIYEQRIHRNLQKTLKHLEQIQATRKAEQKQAMEEAKLLARLRVPGQTAPTEVNGFVFSNAQIDRELDHDRRLHQAKTFYSRQPQPQKAPQTLAA
jgi:hypothetical protein